MSSKSVPDAAMQEAPARAGQNAEAACGAVGSSADGRTGCRTREMQRAIERSLRRVAGGWSTCKRARYECGRDGPC